ncbi:MAG: type I glyceraldehyde-3-phosphate dehydrogenase [Bacteroidales bacterium]|nr:type I glyceraldehyde-3-phosphate dehydrogenase [Bacteroidales bacterium]
MAIKIGINGFGRIGKLVFRLASETKDIEVVHINDRMELSMVAHLLKYDSLHGRFKGEVNCENETLIVNSKPVRVSSYSEPSKIDWAMMGVDIVIDSSGKFKTRAALDGHLKRGAKKVILTCPAGDDSIDRTVVMGVNDEEIKESDIIVSNASCTTNCVAVLLKVLIEEFGVKKAFMNTVHTFTNNQNLQDGFHKDYRRARAAMNNIIPTSSSAIKTTELVLPEIRNKFDGFATRVPVADCSYIELTAHLDKEVTVEKLNGAFKAYSTGSLKRYLEYCTDPIVSSDINNNYYSAVFDSLSSKVLGGDLIQIIGWYDNESAYSARVIDLIRMMNG